MTTGVCVEWFGEKTPPRSEGAYGTAAFARTSRASACDAAVPPAQRRRTPRWDSSWEGKGPRCCPELYPSDLTASLQHASMPAARDASAIANIAQARRIATMRMQWTTELQVAPLGRARPARNVQSSVGCARITRMRCELNGSTPTPHHLAGRNPHAYSHR